MMGMHEHLTVGRRPSGRRGPLVNSYTNAACLVLAYDCFESSPL